jgi:hypothetical protein
VVFSDGTVTLLDERRHSAGIEIRPAFSLPRQNAAVKIMPAKSRRSSDITR